MAAWIKGALTKQGLGEDGAALLVDSLAADATKLNHDVRIFTAFMESRTFARFLETSQVENR